MFLIINYDVEKKRCAKVLKYPKPYMHHIQESVFVGEITDKDYKVIKQGLNKKLLIPTMIALFFIIFLM